MTDPGKELIDRLVRDLRPLPPWALERRLLAALGLGMLGAMALMVLVLGPRHDWAQMLTSPVFLAKLAYAGGLALAGGVATARLARPLGGAGAAVPAALAVFLTLAAAALVSLAEAPAASRRDLVLGSTALVCPFLIALVSMPVLAGLLALLRRLAPTRPLAAGAAAGLLAGAAGTMVYALHCPETGLPFVALWYTAGILLTTALGAALGRFALRW